MNKLVIIVAAVANFYNPQTFGTCRLVKSSPARKILRDKKRVYIRILWILYKPFFILNA